jgi:hypothetical protein
MQHAIDVVKNVFLRDLRFIGGTEIPEDRIGDGAPAPVTVHQFPLLSLADEFPVL